MSLSALLLSVAPSPYAFGENPSCVTGYAEAFLPVCGGREHGAIRAGIERGT
jgi:hypothetical protein